MDTFTKAHRRYVMSRIIRRDTAVELLFRKLAWSSGFRGYRVKSKILGKPDLYFPKQKIAVFIDGCFWHKCPKCFVRPKSRNRYWDPKIEGNVQRDARNNAELRKQKIRVIRFWEHEIKDNSDKCFLKFKKAYEKNV